jgi:hypothetical protein
MTNLYSRPASTEEIDNEQNQGDQHKKVNKAPGNVQNHAQEPKNEKSEDNRP